MSTAQLYHNTLTYYDDLTGSTITAHGFPMSSMQFSRATAFFTQQMPHLTLNLCCRRPQKKQKRTILYILYHIVVYNRTPVN